MNEHLRDRILRKIETLTDERGYQVLDFVEFLESKYAERTIPGQSAFTRFAEAVEDRMRAGKMSAQTITETMGLLNRAVGILNGVAAAGKSMAEDLIGTTAGGTGTSSAGNAGGGGAPGTASASSTSSSASSPSGATGAAPPSPSAQGDGADSSTQGGQRP
jgi:hypothetical protein